MPLTEQDIKELKHLAEAQIVLYEKLLDFIYGLNPKQFRVSPSQHIAAQKVLIKLAASGEIQNFNRLRSYLAPLFSFSPEQRVSFNRHFDVWYDNLKKNVPNVLAGDGNEDAAQQAAALLIGEPGATSNEQPTQTTFEKARRQVKRLWKKPQVLVIALAICFIAAGIFFQPEIRRLLYPPATPTPTPLITPTPTPKSNADARKPAPVEDFYFLLLIAAVIFPLLVWGIWLAWWKFYRKPQLKKCREKLNLKHPRADKSGSELYEAAEIRRFAQELRRHRHIPVASLDPDATVAASVARIGFFTPVYGTRRVSPEYLVLIDRAGYSDQQAHLIDEWIERLKAAGVFVDRYYYDGDPQLCRAAADNPRNPEALVSFIALASSHSDYRLLVFGSPKSFVEVNRPSKLLALLLENWKVRVLLSTAPAESFAERIVRGEGLPVLRADEENLQLLLKAIQEGENEDEEAAAPIEDDAPAVPLYYPFMLLQDESQWLEEAAPDKEEVESLKRELRRYLDDDGYQLLTACAVYPEVLWDLTFYLAHHLIEREKREATLALLVRLPWLRYGKMPDWLRRELLDDLSEKE